jgi:hypothetical protein
LDRNVIPGECVVAQHKLVLECGCPKGNQGEERVLQELAPRYKHNQHAEVKKGQEECKAICDWRKEAGL